MSNDPIPKHPLDEVDPTDEPTQKRPRIIDDLVLLKDATLGQLFGQVNRRVTSVTQYFICEDCNLLCLGRACYLATSKWGYERPFCHQCRLYCKKSGEYYAPSMSYMHEDCSSDSKEDDSSSAD